MSVRAHRLFLCGVASLATFTAVGVRAQARPPRREQSCALAMDGETIVRLTWEGTTSTGGCFFFAGPGALGRDDSYGTRGELGRAGRRAWLTIGPGNFEGNVSGARIALARRSNHDFGGAWRVDETLDGDLPSPTAGACPPLRLRYVYHECDTANPAGCPGHCTIESTVVITP